MRLADPNGAEVEIEAPPLDEREELRREILARYPNGRKRLAILELRHLSNWPVREIAKVIALSPGHVHRLLRETERQMRENFSPRRNTRAMAR